MRTAMLIMAGMLLLAACGQKESGEAQQGDNEDVGTQEQLAERGQDLFRSRSLGEIEIACADCHADFNEALVKDDRIRPGHSILGAHQRVETWNGEFTGEGLRRTAAGAAKCAYLYQEKGSDVETALTADEALALMAYFAYVSPGDEAPRLDWDAVTWPGDPDFDAEAFETELAGIEKLRGNPDRGAEMFDRACAPCHDTGLAPATRLLKRKAQHLPAAVRGGEESMPFFSRDRLTDQDIADIHSFIVR